MQNRAILITLRAAAVVIIATGLNDVIASALPRYEPLYLYLAGIALVALLDGVILGLVTALLSLGFYALLFFQRPFEPTMRAAIPIAAAIGVAVLASLIRGVVRASRRRHAPQPVYVSQPALLETSAVAHVADNVEVLAAIDDLRGELRQAVTELTTARMREGELQERTRNDRAEREAVEMRARQIEQERDWALKTAQEERARGDRDRALRAEAERMLAEMREESAAMAGRLAELELSAHERDRVRTEAAALRRAVDLERARADEEKTLRETFAADAETLRTRIGELEEALAGSAPPSEFDELRRALADTRHARDRARAETIAEKQRADGLERAVAAARAEADAATARAAESESALARLEEAAREERASRERDVREAVAASEQARAHADALSARVAELEAALAHEQTSRERDVRQAVAASERSRADAIALSARIADLETALGQERTARERLDRSVARVAELESALARELGTRERLETEAARVAELEAALAQERTAREQLESAAARAAELERALAEERATRERLDLEAARAAELQASLLEERAARQRLESESEQFDARLQTIVTHLASDHETDLGQVMSEKEEARAEARALSMKLTTVQRKLEDTEALIVETRHAAQVEIDRLRAQLTSAAPVQAPVARPRVLVVHPDADVRGAAGASLERAGYEVVGAGDGLEALRVAIAEQPEVVIAESSMPKMDGRELCQLLKSQKKTSHIRFILLMRAGDDAPRGELIPDEVLRKPVPVETLRATLASLLAQT